MPTIVRLARCVLYVYANDHNPPHFHILTKDSEAAVSIDDLTIMEGSVDKVALKEALEWAADNKEVIREKWNDFNP